MAEPKKPDSPELVNMKEKERVLLDKAKRIEAMDANELQRSGRDINEIKTRNATQLADVRKEIVRLSK
jgi:hypothetical protein